MATSTVEKSWFRDLKDDRLEVCLYGETTGGTPIKMRASGASGPIWKCVEMFEELTGRAVEGDWRRPPRTGPKPIGGQLDLVEQLESLHDEG